jgi:hypothetical protein
MIIYKGEKYACLSCIRGHRSSSCDHRDRALIQVRKRGRPNASNSQRVAMIPGEDGQSHDRHVIDGDLDSLHDHSPVGSNGHNKRFRLRQRQPDAAAVHEELNHAGTAKFVPLGNGLYKRVPLAAAAPPPPPPALPGHEPHLNPNPACCGGGDGQGQDPGRHEERTEASYGTDGGTLPLMIAPMEFDGQPVPAQEEELLGELPSSLYFQASCILGDCQCGPSCTCEGCPVHDPARRIAS